MEGESNETNSWFNIIFTGLNSYATAGITAGIILLVSMASLLSVFYCCWTSRRKTPALQKHVNDELSTADDCVPISMGTFGARFLTPCPSLQSCHHKEKNLARSFLSANFSSVHQRLLKLGSQRPRVKETDAVNLLHSCEEIPTSEQKSLSSSSLLWYSWYCVVSNMRYFDVDVVHLVHISVYQLVGRSVSLVVIQLVNQSDYQSYASCILSSICLLIILSISMSPHLS